ncbi:uncharacterized protein LOC133192206 [Saccostrea echinata]|uniref:uncharacterized protein LOC133192206 n=1 Tax=Saccostrea echinata TaxID=191078 RepID=UPI002A8265C1|nr:uncharacterized protein LOC133192206 [Saccostrea echinata]
MKVSCLSVICLIVGVHGSKRNGDGALISRSISGRRSFITLKCPSGHVFSNVKFRLDSNTSNTISKGSKCWRRSLKAQRMCRWKRKCRIDTKIRTGDCKASAIQLSNLQCIPEDSVMAICRSDNGAVWITNFGRLKTVQVKGKCRKFRRHRATFRNRRNAKNRKSHVEGVVTQERGIVRDRVGWQKKIYRFSCPKNSLIYSLDIHMSNLRLSKRSTRLCKGISPQLLVQKNNCFWKRSCTVSWDAPQIFAISNGVGCTGKQAPLFITKGHECIPKKKIHDICGKREVNGRNGILRSHDDYPWNYRPKQQTCKTLIKIHREGSLYLRIHDLDVDFSHDKFSITHVRGNVTCTLRQSSAEKGVWLYGGQLTILFTVRDRSKSGRGFIISYKNVKTRLPHSPEEMSMCAKIYRH